MNTWSSEYPYMDTHRAYAVNVIDSFNSMYLSKEKWWHKFSIFHILRKYTLLSEWTEIILDLKIIETSNVGKIFSDEFIATKHESHNDDKRKRRNTISGEDYVKIRKTLLNRECETAGWDLAFEAVCLGLFKDEDYARVLLYMAIGCTPEMLETYKELPYSFLLQAAYVVNDIES